MLKNIIKSIIIKIKGPKKEVNYYCRRCGRKLITKQSRELGIGKCCYNKEVRSKTKKLF